MLGCRLPWLVSEPPEVMLEATYGWYWAADVCRQRLGSGRIWRIHWGSRVSPTGG
jgi:hypothetical protein